MDSPGPKASTSRRRIGAVELPELPCIADGNFQTSYSWHSAGVYDGPGLEPSEDDEDGKKGGWILGIDEAGRGPVLGPQVYGCVACPATASDDLKALGFADSKALSEAQRGNLMVEILSGKARATGLQYALRVMHPRDISAGMLQRTNYSLNAQSQDVTVQLIRDFLDRNYPITHVYVDPVGPHEVYEAKLKAIFPTLDFTVIPKADAIFPVVSAASIVAKVTRDVFMEVWTFNEQEGQLNFSSEFGSGYPSDPKTVAWLEKHFDPLFGYPSIARQSWGTIRQLLDKKGWRVKWCEEESVSSIRSYFASNRPNEDKERPVVMKELGLAPVAVL
ncbi:ribonuclease H2 subunit A [Cystobasidium minutum MCA 4210]|uniref:ribonuclease H2 subunit A n=1 Tax=Cystobasidium minutum MCA 4210 TaxID=1397322 RepID=UPI0034CDDA94|eukprot:jgi/Rhomi1/207365/estExt_Genemark1.C_1_t10258